MYDIIKTIINHVWDTTVMSSSEQQIIYYISGAAIIVFTIWILDRIAAFIISTAKGGK